MNTKEVYSALMLGIRDYFKKNNFSKAVIGLSGGLDSSVAAYLVAKAIGSNNLAGILMPDAGTTSDMSVKDAMLVAKNLKIRHHVAAIDEFTGIFQKMNRTLKIRNNALAVANVKARARMVILYYFANIENALVIGTSDKSEIALGYTTKYGDNAADILVIGDLWKTEVFEMGKFMGIPGSILKKKPSAELIPGQTAEKELGASYKVLDSILKMYIEHGMSAQQIISQGFSKRTVKSVIERIRINEHKRKTPPIIRVSDRSFHSLEWRMPVTNKFKS